MGLGANRMVVDVRANVDPSEDGRGGERERITRGICHHMINLRCGEPGEPYR